MREYDLIADAYAEDRRDAVGVPEVEAFVAGLPPGARVLDVGCGNGVPLTRALQRLGLDVVGVDSSTRMLERFRENCPGVPHHCGPIQSFELPDERPFDAAIAWGVLFHLPHAEQAQAIARVASLLVPGGRFLFTSGDADGSIEGAPMHGVPFRYWSFDVEGYRRLLASHGLVLETVEVDAGRNTYYTATKRD